MRTSKQGEVVLEGTPAGYMRLLEAFLEGGYEFLFFSENFCKKHVLFLRHDVDFDVEYAHEMSALEKSVGVKSTYFFLVRSESYNILNKETGHSQI